MLIMGLLIVRFHGHTSYILLTQSILQPLYPTLLILLIARHKTPLTQTLTSIDVDFGSPPPTRSASIATEEVELNSAPNNTAKTGNEYYGSYADDGPARSSVRLEPNRRN